MAKKKQIKSHIIRNFLNPSFDETTLFVMCILFMILYVINGLMRSDLHKLLSSFTEGDDQGYMGIWIILICFFGGICFSIFHAFSKRKKSTIEKAAMLIFAIAVTAGSGIYAGKWMIDNTSEWLLIFPMINVACSGLLLLKFTMMFLRRNIDVSYIKDDDTTVPQLIIGSVAGVIVLIICQFWFKLYWAITLSICIVYTSCINESIQYSLLPFIAPLANAESQFRAACKRALDDGVITAQEKDELKIMAATFGLPRETIADIFKDEKRSYRLSQKKDLSCKDNMTSNFIFSLLARGEKAAKYRIVCKKALSDGKLTVQEKRELTDLAKSLGFSRELAKKIFDDEKRKYLS